MPSVTAPSFQQVEPVVPSRPRGLGCVTILLLALGIPLFAILGISAGLVCYGLAWAFGTPSIGVSIAAGVIALAALILATPLGIGLGVLLLRDNEHPLLKSAGAVVAALLGPILLYQEVLMFAVPGAIGAGLMFNWCQPLVASILLALLAPLGGLVIGYVLFSHTAGDSDSGDGSNWSNYGYSDTVGDNGDGGGE